MILNFYDTRLLEDGSTVLVKEKEKDVNYEPDIANDPGSIVSLMNDVTGMDRLAEEYCYMIALNSACRVTGVFFISKGTANQTLLCPREIYIRALLIGAVMIVICHNHPSGCARATRADIGTTDKIREVGDLIGIPLMDHIIIGRDEYFSFVEKGLP